MGNHWWLWIDLQHNSLTEKNTPINLNKRCAVEVTYERSFYNFHEPFKNLDICQLILSNKVGEAGTLYVCMSGLT